MGIATKWGTGVSGDATATTDKVLTVSDNSVDGTDIALGSDAAGDVMYYNGTDWTRLAKGTKGDRLVMNNGETAPSWGGTGNSQTYSKNCYIKGARLAPVCSISSGGAATGADTTLTHVSLGYDLPPMVVYNSGANTTRIAPVPVVDANCCDGLYLPVTNTDNVGCQITFGASMPDLAATTGGRTCFTVGTDPAFYMKAAIGITDISEFDIMFVGFVGVEAAYVATAAMATTAHLQAAYDEKAGFSLGDNAGDVDINTSKAGADTNTDLTVTDWTDDDVMTMQVNVDAAGAVTYRWWDATETEDTSTGAAAFSFTNGTVVTPMLIFVKCAANTDEPPILDDIQWGYQ